MTTCCEEYGPPAAMLAVYTGVNAGLGAASLAVFTAVNPGLGALFGATHAAISIIATFALFCLVEDADKHMAGLFTISTLISSVITTGIAAGVLALMGIPLSVVVIGAVFISLLITTLATTTFCCGTIKGKKY